VQIYAQFAKTARRTWRQDARIAVVARRGARVVQPRGQVRRAIVTGEYERGCSNLDVK